METSDRIGKIRESQISRPIWFGFRVLADPGGSAMVRGLRIAYNVERHLKEARMVARFQSRRGAAGAATPLSSERSETLYST